MSAENAFTRAMVFLEFEQLEEGEKALREAIQLAETESDEQTRISAMCCLGDLLYSLEQDEEAIQWLKRVWEARSDDPELSEQFAMAEEFLTELGEI